jgi:hypothetical protein
MAALWGRPRLDCPSGKICVTCSDMTKLDMYQLARRGAIARLAELREEESHIYEKFPDLKDKGRVTVSPSADGDFVEKPTRRNYSMSPAMKKKVSERMKAYWATRRSTPSGRKRQSAS